MEFITFEQYINQLKIKEATKKKYLANLKEDSKPNDCAVTVLNHYNKYVMSLKSWQIPILSNPMELEAKERGIICDEWKSVSDMRTRVLEEENRKKEERIKQLEEKLKNLENNR